MELIRGLHNLRPRHRGCVATIGAFDGVHLGHQAVIDHLQQKAEELALPSTVIVFEPLPREFFSPIQAPARIMSFREKFQAMRHLGVDRLLRIRFNAQLREMTARRFVEDVFVAGLGVRYVVLGDDFRFGNDRQGDVRYIQEQGRLHGYEAGPTPTRLWHGERVSSTRIREALEAADFDRAEEMLGRPTGATIWFASPNGARHTAGLRPSGVMPQRAELLRFMFVASSLVVRSGDMPLLV